MESGLRDGANRNRCQKAQLLVVPLSIHPGVVETVLLTSESLTMQEFKNGRHQNLMHTLSQRQAWHNRRRRTRSRMFVICATSVLIAGLGSCGSNPGPMTGNWLLSLMSSDSLEQRTATLSLHQSGNSLSGSISAAGCVKPATVTGSASNNALTINFVEMNGTGTLTGTTNTTFTSASGTYAIAGESCLTSSGSGPWSAVFVSG